MCSIKNAPRFGRHFATFALSLVSLLTFAGASGVSLFDGFTTEAKSALPAPQGTPSPSPTGSPTPQGFEHCSIRLNSSSFSVNESAGQLIIGVTRTCDRVRESKVDFFTRSASATAGSDFAAKSGRVDFADGETSKTITLQIANDAFSEPLESFSLFLTDPGGSAMLVSPSTALITIQDDDSGNPPPPPTPSPSPSATPSPSPEHCAISLGAAAYSVDEGAGKLSIPVNRVCNRVRDSKVDFFTRNGTASDRSDYTFAAGRLYFAEGETTKTIDLLITDDTILEGNETFTLSLTDAGGSAALVMPGSAVITIVENDIAQATSNPLDNAQLFVRQHYSDFLNRPPDDGGLSYWSDRISECGTDDRCIRERRIGVSAAFFIENEFQDTGNYVYRLYRASFGRRPNYEEFMGDRGRLVEGNDLAAAKILLSDDWVKRPEFEDRFPLSLSAFEFVNRLMDTAGLMPFTVERDTLVNEMFSGKTRAQVIRDVVEFAQFKQREHNSAFVVMQYFGYLRRDPDQGGYDFWLNVLNNREPNNYRGMVCAFLTSAEMQERFSSLRTRTDVECGQ